MRAFVAVVALIALTAMARAATIHIVAFGDSATEGWLIERKEAYPAQLQKILRAKGYDVSVTNAGISGDTTKGALARFDEAIGPDTDIAIVEFGTNDLRRRVPVATMHRNLTEIVHILRRRGIEVLLVGLGSLDLSEQARSTGVLYEQWRIVGAKYRASDRQHFNAAGYALAIARSLPAIEALIKRVQDKRR